MQTFLVSTRDKEQNKKTYTKVLLEGLAPDGGLYVPSTYPNLIYGDLQNLSGSSYLDIVLHIKKLLVGEEISEEDLSEMIGNAYSKEKFSYVDSDPISIREIDDGLYLQNLSHGPTASFKDLALQMLGQEMEYVLNARDENLTILGATSGDTGSSAEAALKGLDRVKLFMLSPQEGMSLFQKAQMGSLTGGNIYNIGINGRFDDCQDLVKGIKSDPEFSDLGAVNSINWGRISSQIPYYVYGYLKVAKSVGDEVDFVVPTGNFGNVLSGYYTKMMGVPIRNLIVATNENNVLAKLIESGVYELTPAQITSSPSMDISKASNYERLVHDILGKDPERVSVYMDQFIDKGKVSLADYGLDKDVFKKLGFLQGTSTHKERLESIKYVYGRNGSVIDPHTADGVTVALKRGVGDVPTVVMETALPVKFEDTIKEALGFIPEREERFKGIEKKISDNTFYNVDPERDLIKKYLRDNRFE